MWGNGPHRGLRPFKSGAELPADLTTDTRLAAEVLAAAGGGFAGASGVAGLLLAARAHARDVVAVPATRAVAIIRARARIAGAAGRLDPTMVRLSELCETSNDPFAKDVRKLLRLKYGIDTAQPCGIRVVSSTERRFNPEPLAYDHSSGFLCICPSKENDFHTCDHRTRIDGTAGFVTSTFGMVAASAVVRTIIGK